MKRRLLIISTSFLIILLLLFSTYKVMNSRTFQFFDGITDKVETNQKIVALTFDDGPTENTNQILPLLKKYNIQATFFLIGNEIEEHSKEAQKIVNAGHQVGNHTYSHKRMVFKSPSFIQDEIIKTDELIRKLGYKKEIDFRPPNGKKLVGLPYYLSKVNKETITWNLEPDNHSNTTEGKINYVIEKVTPGSIILLHPMYDKTGEEIKVIEGIIQTLLDKGYTFTTVDALQKLND
ncbi:polysaccharide deacetylase family protein [Metabacillus malikii]|uniref:Chitin deacetylase n=1 Tax=Metabacillus malikii TaxID=1504265 RepID=A0ABT9ZAS2_9BACI|nr:polysaccharide deacetylase family protein [Metabacillus malikii]MDQ0229360.1 chitin deacetylase [Metabacillus malikii]